jgi:DNA-directed RNA polymerase subunit RPC12/RpoP
LQPIVDKVSLDRLKDRQLQVSFLCPYCKSARISLDSSQSIDSWNGVDCPKCSAHLLLDSLSVVMIKDAVVARPS